MYRLSSWQFQALFHSLFKVLFHLSLTVLFRYRSLVNYSIIIAFDVAYHRLNNRQQIKIHHQSLLELQSQTTRLADRAPIIFYAMTVIKITSPTFYIDNITYNLSTLLTMDITQGLTPSLAIIT